MELRNIILITIAGFTLSYARYGKLHNGYDVMQLHARIWKGLLQQCSITIQTISREESPRGEMAQISTHKT